MSSSEEDLVRQIKVGDLLLQTAVTLINLSARRLTVEEEKDLQQVKLGIDAARALVPLLPSEEATPLKDALAQLQMAYVKETQEKPEAEEKPDGPAKPGAQEKPDPEREKARARIWTPPGTT